MNEGKRYVLWGSAGHAKVLASLISNSGGHTIALFDNNPLVTSVLPGVPVYIGLEAFVKWVENETNVNEIYGLAAIGGSHGRDRLAVHKIFHSYGLQLEPIIHPDASVCPTASLGSGSQILAQAVVASDTHIGEGCIINHSATADHECELGDGVHLAPGATLCGCVKLRDNVLVGAGAVVLPRISVGENTVIGAGTVVISDLPSGVVAVGNPARIIKKL